MKPTAGIACIVAGVLFCAWANHADAGAIRDITADGDTIWAVGDAGTVLLSRDAGQTWNSVEVPVGTDFQAVHIAGDTVHLLGGSTIFGHPDARGKAVILRSEDGGETFQAVSTPPAGCLYGGEFEPPAAIVFGEATPEAPSGIWRTVTDGRRWTPVESEQQGYLLGGDFRDVKLGYAVGGDHRIASIRGLSEPRIHPPQTPSRRVLRAAALSSDETCWAAGDDGLLLKSRPGSQPWQQQQIPAPTATGRLLDLETVCSTPEDTVHAGGGLTGATFRSDDGGASWRRLDAPSPGAVHDLAANGDVLLAGGDAGRIWRSTNGAESWELLHGPQGTDVLFIVSATDTSVYPAIVAHALAGAEVAVVFATRGRQSAGAPPEQALRAAAAEAGAASVSVFHSFPSPAMRNDHTLREQDLMSVWSDAVDAPAQDEMLRHMVAAIRLYRPEVLAVGPESPDSVGSRAESGTVSRLAQLAASRAGREDMFEELSRMGLPPWEVRRVFVGMEDNHRRPAAWKAGNGRAARDANFAIDTSAFVADSDECIEMIVQRAIWRLGRTSATDRPARVTGYRCEGEHRRLPLMTTGLTSHSLRPNREVDDYMSQLAVGAHLRFAAARGELATAMGPLLRAAEQADSSENKPGQVLAADRVLLSACGLLRKGRLHEAARADRAFMRVGRSHPLFEQVSVTALARAVSPLWQAQLATNTPQKMFGKEELAKAAESFASWSGWSHSPAGRMLHARALSATGRRADAAEVLEKLADGPYPRHWRRKARLELVGGNVEQLPPSDLPRVIQAAQVNERGRIDGRMKEEFWSDTEQYDLLDSDGERDEEFPDASLRVVRTPGLVVIGVQLPARQDRRRQLDLAVDSGRDGWTQLLLSCDTEGNREVRLLCRAAADSELPDETIGLQATLKEGEYVFETAIPISAVGGSARADMWGFQLRVTFETANGPKCLYAQPQEDPRLLPHRYGLLMLPPAGKPKPSDGDREGQQEKNRDESGEAGESLRVR